MNKKDFFNQQTIEIKKINPEISQKKLTNKILSLWKQYNKHN
jgi:hypothetical protein